jgi:raffinose/stachyose/melibiose transport system permease protein
MAMGAIVFTVLPIMVLFMSLQKYFIKGMTVGAVKG